MPKAHPPELRAAVLATAQAEGITAAAKAHGVGKATVSEWCSEAGVRTVRNETMAQARDAAQITAEARRAIVVERLWEIADKASARELELLRASKLHEVVGARTRAIHDAELLSGRPTNRTEQRTVDSIEAEVERLEQELGYR